MDEKESRIVEARLKLRDRFQQSMKETPASADARPLGRGAPNRHGMPKLPEGLAAHQPLLERMLAKDPADRFKSASDLVGSITL